MRPELPSATATYVAMGRALAQLRGEARGFSDPFALRLLPDEQRAAVEARALGRLPRSPREAVLQGIAFTTSRMMGPRTVAIDEGLAGMPPEFQLVILGAGLDARAHRLAALENSAVFEVDHPASQAYKRERAKGLPVLARALTYVPVDFARDALGVELERHGHVAAVPTAWIWEGVITYLTRAEIAATLEVVRSRSAQGSRLLATYNEPSLGRRVTSALTARGGEPHRSWMSPAEARALFVSHGFTVRDDSDGLRRARHCGLDVGLVELAWVRGHHVVVAEHT